MEGAAPRWCGPAVVLAALVGLGLMADSLRQSSATYDEVAYLRVAARWWRTGDQDEITRMGSPLTFWKLQQVPVLWALDLIGSREMVDRPIDHQRALLPIVRLWSLLIWLVALGLTSFWSRLLYGPRAMAFAAWLFTLSPNLLAHGSLATMELPLLACTTGMFLLFWKFLQTGDRRFFWVTAVLGGLSWSCKFTTVLIPPILALVWWIDICPSKLTLSLREWVPDGRVRGFVFDKTTTPGPIRLVLTIAARMTGFLAVMILANLVVTGFSLLPISPTVGAHPTIEGRFGMGIGPYLQRAIEIPIPRDWVGFLTQIRHQRSGGPSYLFGERRMTGWWSYYFVTLAVKTPLALWMLVASRVALGRRAKSSGRAGMLPGIVVIFLAITAAGSSRNYGIRYLLPMAPLVIVWVSGLAEAGTWARRAAVIGLAGQALAVATIHPFELSYFNVLAGGPAGGRHILADSNLDWGQGAKPLARLQRAHPEFRDLTIYYFGDTDPAHHGVVGRRFVIDAGAVHRDLPPMLSADTEYLAVSASLQWGPWGPEGYFRRLDPIRPVRLTDDATIAIYRTSDVSPPITSRSRAGEWEKGKNHGAARRASPGSRLGDTGSKAPQ